MAAGDEHQDRERRDVALRFLEALGRKAKWPSRVAENSTDSGTTITNTQNTACGLMES